MKKNLKRVLCLAVCLVLCLSILLVQAPSNAAAARIPWLNGNTLWPVGVNYAWLDWDSDFTDSNWDSRFVTIKSQMDTMASQGVHALRWWIFPDGNITPLWSGTGEGSLCTGLPANFITHLTQVADYGKSKGIRLYCCFSSFDWGYNGRTWNHDDIFDNATVRQSFLDNAVKPILQALGTHEGIMGWDVINEPEWLISSADGGDPNGACESFSLANMRAYVKAVADCVHTYAKQGVSVGSASMKWCGGQYQFWTGLGLDFYDFHWYDWATPYFNPLKTAPSALGLDKPCILGEVMPNTQSSSLAMTHQQVLEGLYANGYAGYMPWSWNDTANDCKPYINPSFNNFEAAHPDVNQITGGNTPTPTPSAATPTPTPSAATPTPTPGTATPTPLPTTTTPTPTPSIATPTPTPSTPSPTPTPSTATPTPTPSTATPTPTPTAGTPVPGGVKVQFFNGNLSAATNTIYMNFKLVNTGTTAITLSNVKMRYYYTNDGTQAGSFACDYSTLGSGNITATFTSMGTPVTNADRFVEVGFTTGAGTLGAGANAEVKARLWKSDWSNFTQTNDYSFNPTATNYVDWPKTPAYVSGALAWGTEP